MTLSRRDRWLGRYGLATLNLTAGAIAAHSRDRVARLLGAATLSKGGGVSSPTRADSNLVRADSTLFTADRTI